jgi:signal peptidase I
MTDTGTDTSPTSDLGPPEPDAPRPRRGVVRRNIEWVVIVAVAIVSALVVKTFLIEAFFIPSPSMDPTLKTGDRVLVNKLSYRVHPIHRGDIVVFERPSGISGEPNIRDFIKRVVGLPGETIDSHGDTVFINDKPLKEPYLPAGTRLGSPIERQTIPAKHYFVMGDNRSNSSDSRVFHPIEGAKVVGRAFVLVWKPSRLRLL